MIEKTTTGPCLFILDVGHGNSAVLTDTEGNVVVDAGSGNALCLFLRDKGIQVIDVILISHADEDHIAGLIAILSCEEFTVGIVRLNSDALKGSKLWEDLLYTLDKAHHAGEVDFNVALTARDTGDFDRGAVHVEILAPSLRIAGKGPGSRDYEGRRLTTNSLSAVIRMMKDGRPVALFPGDIDAVGLENLLEDTPDPVAPIAVFPHHGAKAGSGDISSFAVRFCEAVSPGTVIFSIGRGEHGTPQPDIVQAVRDTVPNVRILCTQLSEHCAVNVPAEEPTHLTDAFARGREHRRCCTGTVEVRLEGSAPRILPAREAHSQFIRKAVPKARCT